MTAPAQVARTFKATPLVWWFFRSAISVRRLARSLPKSDGCLLDRSAHCGRRWTFLAALQQPHLSAHFAAPIRARLFLLERDGRSYHCCKPRRTRHCRNSPRDNRPDKSDSSPSAITQAPVPQPKERLHLTDSQACPRCRCCCLLPLRISRCRTRQSAQPPPARRQGGQVHGVMPSLPVVWSRAFHVSEHLTGRRGLDP